MMGDTAAIDPVYIDCAAILRAVDRAARRAPAIYGDQRVRTRTWRRSRNGLPLRLDLPTLRVVLAVDVSGSMSSYYPYLAYLERALERRYQVELWHWSDGAKRMPPRSAVRDWGGGTDIRSLLSDIGRPAVLVVVTDGYIAPSPRDLTFPACPLIWAVIHPGDVSTAPRGADVISMHPPRESGKR
jgi:predicted metal-dependent peptidase